MDVENTDIVGLKLFQAGFERVLQRLSIHSSKIRLNDILPLVILVCSKGCSELGGDNYFVSTFVLCHPLAKKGLGLLILVVAGRVGEVTAPAVEVVENLESSFLVAEPKRVFPSVAE